MILHYMRVYRYIFSAALTHNRLYMLQHFNTWWRCTHLWSTSRTTTFCTTRMSTRKTSTGPSIVESPALCVSSSPLPLSCLMTTSLEPLSPSTTTTIARSVTTHSRHSSHRRWRIRWWRRRRPLTRLCGAMNGSKSSILIGGKYLHITLPSAHSSDVSNTVQQKFLIINTNSFDMLNESSQSFSDVQFLVQKGAVYFYGHFQHFLLLYLWLVAIQSTWLFVAILICFFHVHIVSFALFGRYNFMFCFSPFICLLWSNFDHDLSFWYGSSDNVLLLHTTFDQELTNQTFGYLCGFLNGFVIYPVYRVLNFVRRQVIQNLYICVLFPCAFVFHKNID